MDQSRAFRTEHSTAVRAGRTGPVELLLPGSGGDAREPRADASDRRAVHADTVLRDPAADSMVAQQRLRGQSQASGALDEADGTGGDLPEASAESANRRASDLSVPVARRPDRAPGPGLEYRHCLYSIAGRVRLPRGCDRLVQPICVVLGVVGKYGVELLPVGAGLGVTGEAAARDLQHRPGRAVHEYGVHGSARGAGDPDQHGWTRSGPGQCFYRATVAQCQVRGGLSQGLRERARRGGRARGLLRLLQPRTATPGAWLQDTAERLLGKGREGPDDEQYLHSCPRRAWQVKESIAWGVPAGDDLARRKASLLAG